ncbi:MAG: glycosyltransferase family 4 protein [Candidatus Promineifilaceae bacterium]
MTERLEPPGAERSRAAGAGGRPLRIGIDVTAAVSQGGGIGRYTRELIRALVRQDQANSYHFFSARFPAQLPVADPLPKAANVSLHENWLSERWLYRLWHRLRAPLPLQWFTGRLDLFHAPDFVLPPLAGRTPSLLTVHDLSFARYPDAFTPTLIRFLNRAVPRSIGRATHLLADSEATRSDLMALWRVPADKITVLYSGVSKNFRPVTRPSELEAVRRRYGLPDGPYVLSVGTIQPRKGYQMLIRAFEPLSRALPHDLVIVGGMGWSYEPILAEAAEKGLADRVRFLGFVDDQDLPALYSQAALFAFPSLYEGFGLPILEAMACGAPVVCANASSLPEVAGQAARLAPAGDQAAWSQAMSELLTTPSLRARLVAAGFRQARQFSWKRTAQQLLALYGRLVDA